MTDAQESKRSPLVLVSREEAVLTLRMNRPDRLNALNTELALALVHALLAASEDKTVRAVILTGEGRGFCAGGDLKLLSDARTRNAGHELRDLLAAGKEIILMIARMQKPVLAVVNGPAAGAGMNLALACDLGIASAQATFGQSFARVGMFPDFGGTYLLPRLVGPARAAEMFYTGDMISAEEAGRLGIVNHVVPHAQLAKESGRLAQKLAEAPPLAMRTVKRWLFADEHALELERALEEEGRQQLFCFQSEDAREGFQAFWEKRKPVFHGR
jgi:2-(1,2-epoxy-1,2-dihydrophenyl)acetyl-CoA isomerase